MNLLPQQQKREIRIEFWLRAATVGLVCVAVTGAVGLAIQAPSYFLAVAKERSAQQQLAALERRDETGGVGISETLRITKQKLEALEQQSTTTWSGVAETMLTQKPAGVSIRELSFAREAPQGQDAQVSRVNVSGVAADRRTLRSFVDELRAIEQFGEVTLPVRDLASDANLEFSITVTDVR
jgi:Tfp pilus assembly protein PilN